MTTKEIIQGYFESLKQKSGWEVFLADGIAFTSFVTPIKQAAGKSAYLESTRRFQSHRLRPKNSFKPTPLRGAA